MSASAPRLTGQSRESFGLFDESAGKEANSGVVEAPIGECGRPNNRCAAGGPYWDEAGSDLGRVSSSADEATSHDVAGTHCMDEKIIAEEYRRGVRVRFLGSIRSSSLDFLVGSKRRDVMGK